MKKLLFVFSIITLLAAGCNNKPVVVNPGGPCMQCQVSTTTPSQPQALQTPAYQTAPDMSGWKVYDNGSYGLSFSYPSDYTIRENPNNIVLSNNYYTLTFTHFTDTIRNQIAARYAWELVDMSNQLPQAAEDIRSSPSQPTMYRFSYFTGGGFETQYLFIDHSPSSPGDDELGKYNMVAVDAQGDASQDDAKAQQEGIGDMDTYAYQPDFILAMFKFAK